MIADGLRNFLNAQAISFITFTPIRIQNRPFIKSLPFCLTIHASTGSNILTDTFDHPACRKICLSQSFS